jgi:hypothetical protein
VALLINGIPVLVIECKDADKDEVIARGIAEKGRRCWEGEDIRKLSFQRIDMRNGSAFMTSLGERLFAHVERSEYRVKDLRERTGFSKQVTIRLCGVKLRGCFLCRHGV